MQIRELYNKLKDLGVPEDRYYLHGLYGSTNDDDKLALLIIKNRVGVEYEVYFKERGEKHAVKIFATEDEACEYIYKQLRENKEIEDKYSK